MTNVSMVMLAEMIRDEPRGPDRDALKGLLLAHAYGVKKFMATETAARAELLIHQRLFARAGYPPDMEACYEAHKRTRENMSIEFFDHFQRVLAQNSTRVKLLGELSKVRENKQLPCNERNEQRINQEEYFKALKLSKEEEQRIVRELTEGSQPNPPVLQTQEPPSYAAIAASQADMQREVFRLQEDNRRLMRDRSTWIEQLDRNNLGKACQEADLMSAKAVAKSCTELLDTAFRFIAGLNLQDQPLSVQREQRELVTKVSAFLKPPKIREDT